MGSLSIGELVGTISLNDQFSGPVEKVAKALGISGESFKAVTQFAGGAVAAVAGVTTAIVLLGQRGSDVADVQDGFDSLSASVGSTAEAMLGALQRGTLGTISNFDLMKTANEALGSGLITSAKDMETLASGAKVLSGRVGGDTSKAFDVLTTAMSSGKVAGLKQLGIFVDTDAALEGYAKSIGKTSSQLSDHEKKTALSTATLKALRGELADAGPLTASFSDRIAQGKVAVTNFTDSLGVAIANSPVVAAGMDGIAASIKGAFGGTQQETVKTLTGYVGTFAIFLVDVASTGVSTAQFLTNAFTGTKVIFNALLEAVAAGYAKVLDFMAKQAEAAAALPVVGGLYKELGEKLRTAADFASSLAIGFGETKDKALDSAATTNAAFDAVQATLGKTRDAMVAAADAEVQLGDNAGPAAGGVRGIGDAAHMTEAAIKAMEDATRKGQEAFYDMVASGQDAVIRLQNEITAQTLSGIDARLFAIQQAHDTELAGYQDLALNAPILYEQVTALIEQKYAQQAAAAQGFFSNAAAYAESAGFTTRDQMEQNVASTLAGYMQMVASGEFTSKELKKSWAAYIKAKDELSGSSTLSTLQQFDLIAGAASSILRSVFGKSKVAAIAAVIIDTAAAVVKTLAAYPFPWSLAPAAAAAAAGYAQLQKIQSTDAGFAQGTPDMAFVNFGRVSNVPLHGDEAVINKAQGATLADMVLEAVTERDDRIVQALERMENGAADRDRLMPIRLRDMWAYAGA